MGTRIVERIHCKCVQCFQWLWRLPRRLHHLYEMWLIIVQAHRRIEAARAQAAIRGSHKVVTVNWWVGSSHRAFERKRRWPGVALSAAAILSVFAILGLAARHYVHASAGVTYEAAGHPQTALLEDGSRIDMSADARMRVTFTDKLRRVQLLTGEAIFTVAHDAFRAFVVETPVAEVVGSEKFGIQVGSTVTVSAYAGEARVRPLDSRGKRPLEVKVTPGSPYRVPAPVEDHRAARFANVFARRDPQVEHG